MWIDGPLHVEDRDPKDRVWVAGTGPHRAMPTKSVVCEDTQRCHMTEWWRAAGYVAGSAANDLERCTANLFSTGEGSEGMRVQSHVAGDHGHDRLTVDLEHERLHDGGDVASDGRGGLVGGPDGVCELERLHHHSERRSGRHDPFYC